MLSIVSPSSRYPTPTGISANVSSTSSFVTANPVNPFTRTAYRTTTASNQPQRRGRPVVAPNSPPSSRIRCATSGAASVGSGPLPTRVVYAFTTPSTASIAVGPIPTPTAAPPAVVLDEVTYGYVPWSTSSSAPCAPSSRTDSPRSNASYTTRPASTASGSRRGASRASNLQG